MNRGDRKGLTDFLSREEWGHVGFSSRMKSRAEEQAAVYLRTDAFESITDGLLCSRSGLLIPALSGDAKKVEGSLGELFDSGQGRRQPIRKIRSIMGLRDHVSALEENIDGRSYASIDYHLMVATEAPPLTGDNDGIVCKRAKLRDSSSLYPLQKAYEIEEVLLNPATFSQRVCYLNLQKSLRNDLIIYAQIDGRIVAKAGTNASSFTFDQIGGVYTVESMRNRGVGELLMKKLLREIIAAGKGACLFVKKHNAAAIKLYRKLGFTIRNEFRIAYFR